MEDPLAKLRSALPDGYLIDGLCGKGAQGSVYRGTCRSRPAALKIFSPDSSRSIERIRREIAALQGNHHPCLVQLIDVTEIVVDGANYPILAYEYHGGGDLSTLLEAASSLLTENQLCEMGEQVGGAVEALWSRRIVHRDIKPTNIVRADDGRFVLVDIGVARHLDLRTLTAWGPLGTPGFMSPEQALGRKRLTINSDIFSLGVTIFHIAAKAHPFHLRQDLIGRQAARPLKELRPDLSDGFVQLIHSMMSAAPAERPAQISSRFARLRS